MFNALLKSKTEEIQRILSDNIPDKICENLEIVSAMEYSINAGGKRLRPLIMKSFYGLYNGGGAEVESFMAAMEMLHTYSLVHDDLPALDNDDYRRGLPTTHRQYGEAVAILAGDGLLHLAYETALSAFDCGSNQQSVIKALKIFGQKTGLNGMFGGQAADVINTGKEISDDLMYYIYSKKTGALIEGSMMIGAALAGASDDDIRIIESIGADIGLAFQIRDDILDIYGNEHVLGKPVNSDEKNNKKTYVTVNGREKSQRDIELLTDRAIDNLNQIGYNNNEREFLVALFRYLTSRNA